MRLEIADRKFNPRDLSTNYREARNNLMGSSWLRPKPEPKPEPIQLAPEPIQHAHEINLDAVGYTFGAYYSAEANIDLTYDKVTIRKVINAVAGFFGFPVNDLESQCRAAPITHARQIAMYLARELTTKSLPAIGRMLGNRDHTTVMHGHQKIRRLIETDELLRKDIDAIRKLVCD
jgi:chromosomal replication initiator protein